MSRLAALLAVVAAGLGIAPAVVQATPPTPPPPVIVTTAPPNVIAPPTIGPPTIAPPTTVSAPASSAPVTSSTTLDRVATTGEDDSWTGRHIATVVAASVVALAIVGFVYGRVRSHQRPATSSALATTSATSTSTRANPPPE